MSAARFPVLEILSGINTSYTISLPASSVLRTSGYGPTAEMQSGFRLLHIGAIPADRDVDTDGIRGLIIRQAKSVLGKECQDLRSRQKHYAESLILILMDIMESAGTRLGWRSPGISHL